MKGSPSKSGNAVPWMRRMASYAAVLLIGFLLGFFSMWVRSRETATDLTAATSRLDVARADNALASVVAARQLATSTMQNTLASAVIDAQRGDYESARQAVSSFFTVLRTEASKGPASSLSQAQIDEVEPMFTRRDETISLLARNDPAATGRLSDLYVAFRELMTK